MRHLKGHLSVSISCLQRQASRERWSLTRCRERQSTCLDRSRLATEPRFCTSPSASTINGTQPTPTLEADSTESPLPALKLFNTMSRSKETFIPQHPPNVSLYVCGVTVYDYSHLGHARAYVSFDLLFRLLCALGYDVQYVRNFTDVDDKIINRAQETQESPTELAEKFIQEFHQDMASLSCLPPSAEPRATQYIPQMIQMIQKIVSNGHGYETDGDVFFDTQSVPHYGRLSKRAAEDNRPGERISVDDRKRHPSDFALWKSAKAGEPFWESPWGKGRPGWHIECSAMVRELIGPVVDIHGGGSDLIFPHHENELAQSEAAAAPCDRQLYLNGTDFVHYWVHNGFVNIGDEKMSKSLGNFFTIREVLSHHHPMTLRWMLLSAQYRQPLNYSEGLMQEAATNVYYLYQTLCDAMEVLGQLEGPSDAALGALYRDSEMVKGVMDALCDDVNSALALATIYGHLKSLNELLHTKKGRKDKQRVPKLTTGSRDVMCCLRVMGFDVTAPERVIQELKGLTLKRVGLSEEDVLNCIQARDQARFEKDYAKADALRQTLTEKGIAMCDSPHGTTWRPA